MTEQTSEEQTERYISIMETIASGATPPKEELDWFAETSLEFAIATANMYQETTTLINAVNNLLNAIAEHIDPKTADPAIVVAVTTIAMMLGHFAPEDLSMNIAGEVLQ